MPNKVRRLLVGAAVAGLFAGATTVAVSAPTPPANQKSAKSTKNPTTDYHC